jgi:hypothetical protein
MSGVFQNIDPPPPSSPGESVPPAFGAGGTHSLVGEGGGGSIFWKTPDTALYSTYVSTLCFKSRMYFYLYTKAVLDIPNNGVFVPHPPPHP